MMRFLSQRWVRVAITASVCVLAVLAFGEVAFAQDAAQFGLDSQFDPGLTAQDPRLIIARIIRALLGFLGVLAVGLLIYGGIVWMTASGREETVLKAQRILVNAGIGLVIILSAFAITQFVLSTLLDATGANQVSGTDVGSGGGGPPGGVPFGSGFTLSEVVPSGSVPLRNVVVQMAFSSNVDRSTVADNVVVRVSGTSTPVAGTFETTGPVIRFTPEAACPAPNEGRNCFAANTAYDVVVASGLKGTNGSFVDCGFSGCSETFVTGELVDVTPPSITITYPVDGDSVSTSPDLPITMTVTDDAAIGLVEGLADNEVVGTDAPGGVTTTYTAIVNWSTTGLVPQSLHTLGGAVSDLAGQRVEALDISVVARPESCFDGVQNAGETGLDCGGDASSANYCGACSGGACTTDSACATGSCVANVCVEVPQIVSVTPTNGAPGTFVTIEGEALGTGEGTVRFLGDPEDPSDDVVAGLACSAWSPTQVVVAVPVPTGLSIGPIQIETSSGATDRTDDATGPVLPDFDIDNTDRPGLCAVTPAQGVSGDVVAVTGSALGEGGAGTQVFMDESLVTGLSDWSATGFNAIVPPTPVGQKDVVVRVGGVDSNPVQFTVQSPDAGQTPSISYITPEAGPSGEYLTLFGENFGTTGTVYFVDPATGNEAVGDVSFPEVCTVDSWTRSAVTVKVPDTYLTPSGAAINIGAHNIRIERSPSLVSQEVGFEITSGTPGPGICGMTPVSGPTGTTVTIFGENFGSVPGDVTFFNGQTASLGTWTNQSISAEVPAAAATGPVTVSVNGNISNEVNFEVGACDPGNDTCGTGTRCCANALACTPLAVDCEASVPETNYLFEWVTGPIPVVPRVIRQCDTPDQIDRIVSPSPWDGRSDGDAVCTNAKVAAAFTVPVTNINATSVLVQACTGSDPGTPCTQVSDTVVDGSFSVLGDRFEFTPTTPWATDTTYQVTLTTDILASGANGEPLAAPFVWSFTTRSQPEPCAIEDVLVTPGITTLTENGNGVLDEDDAGDVALTANGIGSDVCVLLDINEPVSWSTSNNVGIPASPSVTLQSLPGGDDTQRLVRADNESANGPVSVIATLVQQAVSGLGLVTVDYTDPEIQNYWPNCGSACVNAQLGMQFNTAMDPSTLNASSIVLQECQTELCEQFVSTIPVTIPAMTQDDTVQVIVPTITLSPGSFYRVEVDGSVASASGVPLTGLNYGQAYSWTFRVRTDGALCTVTRVDTTPSQVTLNAIGERQAFTSTPFGPPDACSDKGQRLNGNDYNWSWTSSNTTTATLVGNGVLDLGSAPGCSANCVSAGSQAGIAVCGDGVRDVTFEECDDGNTTPGDGCSSTCLWEGLAACGGPGQPGCCGNGVQDPFEECDDGNSAAGDGCSAVCLNEGSQAVGSQCGNGAIGYLPSSGGEDCDDGNTVNGDGCSSQCLYEGSSSIGVAVCGNGVLESSGGEQCDDGNALDGDGCSSSCLVQVLATCSSTDGVSCCGNGVLDPANNEQCDGSEGCSASCRYAGSSYLYASPSFCGDGIVGTGEDPVCEVAGGNGYVDPTQIAEVSASIASQNVPANGLYETDITATESTSGEAGVAELSVSCTCEASFECPTGGVAYACGGATGCCAPRPSAPTFYPAGGAGNVCRNTQVRAIFGDFIDRSTLTDDGGQPMVALRVQGATSATCNTAGGFTYVAMEPVEMPFLPRLVNRALTQVSSWFRLSGARALETGCYAPATLVPVDEADHTEVIVQYTAVLDPLTTYEIVVVGDMAPTDAVEAGVLTLAGAGINAPSGEVVSTFTTGNEICSLTRLEVEDTTGNGLYTSANSTHDFSATAYTRVNGQLAPISPVPGVYDWDVSWFVPLDSDVVALTGDTVGVTEEVTSGQISGDEQVSAIATVSTDTFGASLSVGESVTGSLRARVFLCEVPWPDDVTTPGFDAPLVDSEGNVNGLDEGAFWSNFSTLYCRAEEVPDDGQTGLLPALQVIQPAAPAPGVDKEFILRHPTSAEAIGIRVIANTGVDANGDGDVLDAGDVPGYLPVNLWYQAQGFTGTPTATTVDGFRAVQDGRTTYIGAANMRSGGDIEPTIYAVSYSLDASPEMIDIYNQVLRNFQFFAGTEAPYELANPRVCVDASGAEVQNPDGGLYSCSADLDCTAFTGEPTDVCDAPVDKIRRDITRIEDLRSIEASIASYGTVNRHCSVTTNLVCVTDANCPGTETCEASVPLLDAGTFLRGWSTSAWPSWTTELGNELGTALPQDPLNAYVGCAAGADSDTCWNGDTNTFQCSEGSYVYRYQRSGIESASLFADLETPTQGTSGMAWTSVPQPATDYVTLTIGNHGLSGVPATPSVCTGAVYGAAGVCGDGVLGELSPGVPEVCEIGQTSLESCTADFNEDGVVDATEVGVRATTCTATCDAYTSDSTGDGVPDAPCIQLFCGNGVIDAGEVCDDGEFNGLYGYCSTQCDYNPATTLLCGNGVVEGPEVCDLGSANGQYSVAGACGWNCSDLGPRCGDGIVNGGEQCDSSVLSWDGALCSDDFSTCTTDADCNPGATCGDGSAANDGNQFTFDTVLDACPLIGFCVGGANDGAECNPSTGAVVNGGTCATGGGVCTQFETERTRTCNGDISVPADACTWNAWSDCLPQGSCGDGVVDVGEQCDDGNSDNNDGCTNVCQANVCGDGFLNPATESCDLGAANAASADAACSANYGGVCSYCTTSCTYETVSGGFCGDGIVQVEGGEICDGSTPLYYFDYDAVTQTTYQGSVCYSPGVSNDPLNPSATCEAIGACNGGVNNGEVCGVGVSPANGCLEPGDGGSCEPAVCNQSCGNACPFNYQSIYALSQPWDSSVNASLANAGFSDSIELFSYETNGVCSDNSDNPGDPCQVDLHCNPNGGSAGTCTYPNVPDLAKVQFPVCRVGSHLLADVNYDITYPELDVVFVVDASASMNTTLPNSSVTRWQAMKDAMDDAVDTLYDTYSQANVRVGVVSFGGNGIDDLEGASQPYSFPGGYDPEQSSRDCPTEPYWNASTGAYEWPADWQDIGYTTSTGLRENSAACVHLAPSTNQSAVEGVIQGLQNPAGTATTGSATPTPVGLKRAKEVLDQFPVTNKKVVVLFSDGPPSCYHDDPNAPLNSYDPECTPIADALQDYAEDIKADGIDLYTAYFGPDPELPATSNGQRREGRLFQVLSSDCPVGWATPANLDPFTPFNSTQYTNGVRSYSRYQACTDTRAYSYYGNEPDAFDGMFQSIVNNIVNARVFLGNDTTGVSSTLLSEGPQVSVQLPTDFVCPVAPRCSDTGLACATDADCNPDATCDPTVDIRMEFPGDGTVTIENFQFLYCAP